jgi:hypothetical protein
MTPWQAPELSIVIKKMQKRAIRVRAGAWD